MDFLPFSRDEFLNLFATYNEAIWPTQIIANGIGLGIGTLVLWPSSSAVKDKFIAVGLAIMWAWTGVAYHWVHFTTLNGAAIVFGAFFVLEALLLIAFGVARPRVHWPPASPTTQVVAGLMIVYALLLYPAIGLATGHSYSNLPMFGVTPCPLTIFTFGVLILSSSRVPTLTLAIPLLWSIIGGSASVLLEIAQDWVLPVSGFIAASIILSRSKEAGAESH